MKIDVIEGNLILDCLLQWEVVKEVHCIVLERPRDQRDWLDPDSNYSLTNKLIPQSVSDAWSFHKGNQYLKVHSSRVKNLGIISKYKFIRPHFHIIQVGDMDSQSYVTPLLALSNLYLIGDGKSLNTKPSNKRHEMTYNNVKRYWRNIDDIDKDVYDVGFPYVMATSVDHRNPEGQIEALEKQFDGMNIHILLFDDPYDGQHKPLFPEEGKPLRGWKKSGKRSKEVYERNHWHNDRWAGSSNDALCDRMYAVRKGILRRRKTTHSKEGVAEIKKKYRYADMHRYLKQLNNLIKANTKKFDKNNNEKGKQAFLEKMDKKIEEWKQEMLDLGHDVCENKQDCKLCGGE